MFRVIIKNSKGETVIVLQTDVRSEARAVEAVAKKSGYQAGTMVEIPASDRVVKFKGVD